MRDTIEVFQNDNGYLKFYVRVPDIQALKGYIVTTAWFVVKQSKFDADIDALITKTVTSTEVIGQGLIINPSTYGGDVRFDLIPSDTVNLIPDRNYYYVVKYKTSEGNVYTLKADIFRVKAGISRIS
jgi:hypothetical protein